MEKDEPVDWKSHYITLWESVKFILYFEHLGQISPTVTPFQRKRDIGEIFEYLSGIEANHSNGPLTVQNAFT